MMAPCRFGWLHLPLRHHDAPEITSDRATATVCAV
jgi:hypothetical protein